MSAGDYVIRRNNANTDALPNGGADLDLLWDTAVANVGSGITYSSGTFTLGETGRFLVLCSDQYGTTDTSSNQRNNVITYMNLAGTDLEQGQTTGYIRRTNGAQEYINFAAAIINVATTAGNGDDLIITHVRVDASTTDTVNRIADRSGITIIKLDDAWNYAHYQSSAAFTPSTTANVHTTMDIASNIEEDSPFSRTGNVVDIATNNMVLAIYSYRNATTNSGRTEAQAFLELNSVEVPGSWTQTYGPRATNGCDNGGDCGMCLLEPTSGDDLTLEFVSRDTVNENWLCSLQLVELPAAAKAIIVEATTGNINTAATNFTWDTAARNSDTDVFTHTPGNANLDVDVAGDYLAIVSLAVENDAGSGTLREMPAVQFRVETTNLDIIGGTTYNRVSGSSNHGTINCAALLTGLNADDSVYTHNDRIGTQTGTVTQTSGAMSLLQLDSLFAAGGDPTITDVETDEDFRDGDTALTITGTNFEAAVGTGKVELSDNATYATGTKVEQTDTSWADTSIDFTAVLGALAPGPLWLWVTNDTGDRNVTGFVVNVHRKIAFELSLSPNITGEDPITSGIEELTGGTGTFTSGIVTENTNPVTTVDIGSDGRTEIAFSIAATTDAIDAAIYEFRVVQADGTPFDTYPGTLARWTISGAATIAVGQVAETDLAQAITTAPSNTIAYGQAAETDLAQAITPVPSIGIAYGQIAETDLAQAVTPAPGVVTIAVGQITETDLAQTVTPAPGEITIAYGQAAETDLAQTITAALSNTIAYGQAAETDLAQVITPVHVLIAAQSAFRFGADDGSEALHTWLAAQNVNISQVAGIPAILRIQVDNTGNPPSRQMKLQVKKTSDPDSAYKDVAVG